MPFPSILQALAFWASEAPEQRALTFLDAAGQEVRVATYASLLSDIRQAGWQWHCLGVAPGDVVLLAMDHSYSLVVGFLGALYAGATPVITPYPRPAALGAYVDQLSELARHTAARAVFAPPAVTELAHDRLARLDCRVCSFELAAADAPPASFVAHVRGAEDPLYLQLTSGTTGRPKLAVLSQRAVMANIAQVFAARHRAGGPVVGCMPFNHDGGLMLCLLIPLVMGQSSIHISPADWIATPALLWQAATTYRGALTFLPNFALNFMVRRIPVHQTGAYRLDSLHTVIVAAELTTWASIQAFQKQFGPVGLRAESICGAYGMAEQVVGVTFGVLGLPVRLDPVDHELLRSQGVATVVAFDSGNTQAVVGCGQPIAGTEISVVDPERRPVPERTIGEILVRSDHCFSGYWEQPELTAHVMHEKWYCTGDLGYLAEGELFILGRKDDLLIVGGQNIQPQAIEEIATNLLGDRGRLSVAFGLREETVGTESAVLVCELRADESESQCRAWRAEIMRRVAALLDVTLADIRFVPKGWVVQADAKIGRAASRRKYLDAGYRPQSLAHAMLHTAGDAPDRLEAALTALVRDTLGTPDVQPQDNFFDLGGDSLAVLRLVLAVEAATGQRVPTEFFRVPTVATLVWLLTGAPAPLPAQQPDTPVRAVTASSPGKRWLSSWRRRTRSLPQRVRVPMRTIIEEQAFRRPYFEGVQWLLRWCGQPWVQAALYPQESQRVRRFAASMGTPAAHVAQEVTLSLTAHVIHQRWLAEAGLEGHRVRPKSALIAELESALGSSLITRQQRRCFCVVGKEYLLQAVERRHGTLLVGAHPSLPFVAVGHFTSAIWLGHAQYAETAQRLGMLRPGGGKGDWWLAARTAVARDAYDLLKQGDLIVLMGDEQNALYGEPVMIGDRLHRLSRGFAELAVASGATVLPFYTELLTDGQVRIVIAPPLTWEQQVSRNEQVAAGVRAYAHRQAAHWQQTPSVVPLAIVAQHLAQPVVTEHDKK